MGSFTSSITTDIQDYVELEQEQVILNQLSSYISSLEKNEKDLNKVESSFLPVARSFIINVIGNAQIESYQRYKSFTKTDIDIMRTIHRIPYFDVDKNNEVKHLIHSLKKVFDIAKLDKIEKTILQMKNIRVYQGNSFTTIDYQLLDILEYITQICIKNKNNPLNHWTHIFDFLFRGTNIRISNRTSKLEGSKVSKENILFHCYSPNSGFGSHQNIDLSICNISDQDKDKSILQSQSIVSNKNISDDLVKVYDLTIDQDFFPICIQFTGYVGYLYSIRKYKGIFIASRVCESKIYIPRTVEEFHSFLYNDHILEILCNLKRHYVNMAKLVRHASLTT